MPIKLATRDWSAKDEALSFEGGHRHRLVVTGQAETTGTNQHVSLVEATPQGINPKILLLDLKVTISPGASGHIVSWKQVTFEKEIGAHAYDHVEIKGEVAAAVTVKVMEFTV